MDSINDLPLEERPQYRLRHHGAESLSDSELLALVLGTKNLTKARELASTGLRDLSRSSKDVKLAAVFELTRRLRSQEFDPKEPVRDPDSLARRLIALHSHKPQEILGAAYLDSRNVVITERVIFIGTVNTATVSTRDIFRIALELNAAGIILFHQHPSGNPEPSAEDILFTRKAVEAGKLLCIDVVDHLILGHNQYVSLKSKGYL